MNRRFFIGASAALLAPLMSEAQRNAVPRLKAVAFDAFAIFDLSILREACEAAVVGRGALLAELWRSRLFEYQWLAALAGQYRNFEATADGALRFAAEALEIPLPPRSREVLLETLFRLRPWPDVPAALQALKRLDLKLMILSNATEAMLKSGVENAGIADFFERRLSTDAIRTFKPDWRAYRLGVEASGLRKEEILFVASAGWDVAGAAWFGYPTFWNNRAGVPAEGLGSPPDGQGKSLNDLVEFVRSCGLTHGCHISQT